MATASGTKVYSDLEIHKVANGFIAFPKWTGRDYGNCIEFAEFRVFRNSGELAAWLVTYYAEAS